jgi:nitrate reductase delta subunit
MTDRQTVLLAASLLLRYPDEDAYAQRGTVALALSSLPNCAGRDKLVKFLELTNPLGRHGLEEHYVAVLDRRRRCCLYLTWWTDGETRRRGLALAELKANYRRAGWELDTGELPDFLPVVLEFVARTPESVSLPILHRYRAGIELLRLALVEQASPYANAVAAVSEALGLPSAADRVAALALARTGPPTETVGVSTSRDLGPTSLLPTHLAGTR